MLAPKQILVVVETEGWKSKTEMVWVATEEQPSSVVVVNDTV